MKNNLVLYEISWEVCNKVGGIHTVINSKYNQAKNNFENYYLVGPFVENKTNEFEEKQVPEEFNGAFEYLKSLGIILHFGTSNQLENSKVILVEYLGFRENINDIKSKLWEKYSIDSLNSNWFDFDEAILWSWCVGLAVESLEYSFNREVLVHAHEWMSGGAIFALDNLEKQEKFKTIFTTHATMLGRTLSGVGVNLYDELEFIENPEEKARDLGIITKFQTEKTLAKISDSFTTVSDTTAYEAEKFFEKKVDNVLINGFDNSSCLTIDEVLENFVKSRNKINQFLENHFEGIDLDKVKIFYTSGRNEVRNKGVDIYIKSLAKLNEKLKQEENSVRIVNFILLMSGEFEPIQDKSNSILTHDCGDHEVLRLLRENNLNNLPEDKVLNIFIPVMLDGNDGVINMEYYEFISGTDLGVFPSLYEPWGYTPLESISFGVPTLTSDLAGFGQSIHNSCGNTCSSVSILQRDKLEEDIVVELLMIYLNMEVHLNKKSTLFQKEVAKLLARKYDWKHVYSNYINEYARLLE